MLTLFQVRAEKEAQGFDKETYEHSCQAQAQSRSNTRTPTTTPVVPSGKAVSYYLLKMEGPLSDLDTIRTVGRIHAASKVTSIPGTDDEGNPTKFCVVDLSARTHIEGWLAAAAAAEKGIPFFRPTFVPYSRGADKSLSSTSLAPTLGVDATLPHRRIDSTTATEPRPTQSEYPVWYLFYGTLADRDVLGRLLGVLDDGDSVYVRYRPASVAGGRLVEWGGKYKALVDSPGGGGGKSSVVVEGAAFLVESEEVEDALRCYETDRYEAVRCDIRIGMGDDDQSLVKGLTFRFLV